MSPHRDQFQHTVRSAMWITGSALRGMGKCEWQSKDRAGCQDCSKYRSVYMGREDSEIFAISTLYFFPNSSADV